MIGGATCESHVRVPRGRARSLVATLLCTNSRLSTTRFYDRSRSSSTRAERLGARGSKGAERRLRAGWRLPPPQA
jgi:hypothetical protein